MSNVENLPEKRRTKGVSPGRREFVAAKHCGHPVERDPKKIREKIQEIARKGEKVRLNIGAREPLLRETVLLERYARGMARLEIRLRNIEEHGPDTDPCKIVKGWKTSHPGEGLCRFHCKCRGSKTFHPEDKLRYAADPKMQKRLRDKMDEMEAAQTDLLDMKPEILLLKAAIAVFIEEKSATLYEPENIKSLGLLQEQIRRTVDSINNKTFNTMVTKEAFDYIMFLMGEAVAKILKDEPDKLDKIMDAWQRISIQTSHKRNERTLAHFKQ